MNPQEFLHRNITTKNLGIKISHYRDCKEKNYNIPESRDKKNIRVWPYRKNSLFKASNYYEDIASMHSDTVIEKSQHTTMHKTMLFLVSNRKSMRTCCI